ncbi:unnamed protein product, partial [Staurois parvus]
MGVEDTEWRPVEGLAEGGGASGGIGRGVEDTEWRPVEGLAEGGGGDGAVGKMREWMSCLVVSGVRNVRILAMLRRWSLHVAEVESACCGGGVCMLRRW